MTFVLLVKVRSLRTRPEEEAPPPLRCAEHAKPEKLHRNRLRSFQFLPEASTMNSVVFTPTCSKFMKPLCKAVQTSRDPGADADAPAMTSWNTLELSTSDDPTCGPLFPCDPSVSCSFLYKHRQTDGFSSWEPPILWAHTFTAHLIESNSFWIHQFTNDCKKQSFWNTNSRRYGICPVGFLAWDLQLTRLCCQAAAKRSASHRRWPIFKLPMNRFQSKLDQNHSCWYKLQTFTN